MLTYLYSLFYLHVNLYHRFGGSFAGCALTKPDHNHAATERTPGHDDATDHLVNNRRVVQRYHIWVVKVQTNRVKVEGRRKL